MRSKNLKYEAPEVVVAMECCDCVKQPSMLRRETECDGDCDT